MKTRACVICLFLVLGGLATRAFSDELVIDIPVTPFSMTVDGSGLAKFTGEEIQYLSTGGEPAIPYQVIKAILPPDARLETVVVSIQETKLEPVSGVFQVAPMPPAAAWKDGRQILAWPKDKAIADGKDQGIYEKDALFPATLVGPVNSGQIRNWKLVEIPVGLCCYNPVSQELLRLSRGRLSIHFSRLAAALSPQMSNAVTVDRLGEARVRKIAANYNQMVSAYPGRGAQISAAAAGRGYAIITTNAIQTGSRQLSAFVNSKEQRGFEVTVVTEKEWGGGTGNAASEKIRAWLKANYLGRSIEHVLLIGNPNPSTGDVPMKMLWPRNNEADFKESPSDYYYADLTGDWDLDGDGRYGEWRQDFGAGGVDRNWEVIVGRIPYYGDMNDLDHILEKIIAYENSTTAGAAWRRNILLPMKPSDSITPGYHLGEAIRAGIVTSKRGWDYHRIYDSYDDADVGVFTPPETLNCTADNVTAAWNAADFGAVFWWTHGYETEAVDVMDLSHAATLDDDHPAFTFQVSCYNSTPEDDSNLSYSILKNGGIATISATRASWYQPGQMNFAGSATNAGLAYECAQRVIGEEMECGRALFDAKQQISPTDSPWWMNFTDFNIFGDPATLLVLSDQKILDNGDSGTKASGTWASQATADAYGDNCLASTQAGASYEYSASVSGAQDVSLWWTEDTTRCADTEIQVFDGSSLLGRKEVDQRKNGGRWNSLGTFKFSGSAKVVVRSKGSCSASADAALWAPRTVFHVASDAPAGGDGTSWAEAFQSIGQAVEAAYSGDEIWVKEGNYALSQTIEMDKINLGLYGGFAGSETARNQRDPKAHQTIVSGAGVVRCFRLRVETTVDGLIITHGSAADYGGGMWLDASASIINCTFSNNFSSQLGGALYLAPGSSASIAHCTFSNNESGSRGGAICGSAEYFAISDSVFTGNHARWYGGGIYINESCSPSIANTVFAQNRADEGGGIYCRPGSFSRIVNCSFAKNSAVKTGGGMVCLDAAPAVTNSIFWQDSAPSNPEIDHPAGQAPSVSYCDIDQNGYADSNGNIRLDPTFVDLDHNDLHLLATSPCIDSGNTAAAVNITSDLDDLMRPMDGDEDDQSVIDMGALEYVPDDDGIPDDWELEHFGDLEQSSAEDPDEDGLSNLEEFNNNTNPTNSDTDGDDLPDGWEVTYHLDPLDEAGDNGKSGDPDKDGWTNYEEYKNGYDPSEANLSGNVNPETADFGKVQVGKSAVIILTVSNTQKKGDLQVGAIAIEGKNASEFKIEEDNCSGKLFNSTESGTIKVVFTPASLGAKTADLNIPLNDPDNPLIRVPLSGTGQSASSSAPQGGGGGGGGGCFIGTSSVGSFAH